MGGGVKVDGVANERGLQGKWGKYEGMHSCLDGMVCVVRSFLSHVYLSILY